MSQYCNNILETIGRTPLVRLNRVAREMSATVLAKVETFNPGNSVKDRMAVKMIEDAEKEGNLKSGGTVIEGTSGNTGMGLALACIVKGYKLICTTNDKQSREKLDVLRAMGAEVVVCPTNVEPEDPRSYYSVAARLNREIPNSYYPDQYNNLSNRQAHYETTGPEIWDQTEGKVTHFVVGVGTGGTISGVGQYLKEQNPKVKVWGIDTYGSVFKKYHETGEFDKKEIYPYITEGIGEDVLPANVDFDIIDLFEKVSDRDGALMARRLAREEGIFVGYSAGSAVAGLIQLKDKLRKTDLVVVLFHDHGSRYVAKLFNDDWMRERGFIERKKFTSLDLIASHRDKKLIVVEAGDKVHSAVSLMQQYDISQIPVKQNGKFVGTLNEHCVFSKLLQDPSCKEARAGDVMQPPLPVVDAGASLEEVSGKIDRENRAVLVKDHAGEYHIITMHDIIVAVSK